MVPGAVSKAPLRAPIFALFVVAASGLAAMAVSCGPSAGPPRIGNLHPVKPGAPTDACTFDDSTVLGGGSVDLSGSGRFTVELDVVSGSTSPAASNPPGSATDGASQNGFYAEEVDFTYQPSDPALVIPAYRGLDYFYLAPGGINHVFLNLVSAAALDSLRTAVTGADSAIVSIQIRIKGRYSNGTPVESNQVSFPMLFFTSGTDLSTLCPPLPNPDGGPNIFDRVAPVGPCGDIGGQNGAPLTCCSDPRGFVQTACGS